MIIIVGGLTRSHVWTLVNNPYFFTSVGVDYILIARLLCSSQIHLVIWEMFFIVNIFHFCLLKKNIMIEIFQELLKYNFYSKISFTQCNNHVYLKIQQIFWIYIYIYILMKYTIGQSISREVIWLRVSFFNSKKLGLSPDTHRTLPLVKNN